MDISDHWTTFARSALPQYAWAIDELSPTLDLDALCIELDIITGVPALYLRSDLLARYAPTWNARWSMDMLVDKARMVGVADARLACWASIASTRAALSAMGLEDPVSLENLNKLERWCRYGGQVKLQPTPNDTYNLRNFVGAFANMVALTWRGGTLVGDGDLAGLVILNLGGMSPYYPAVDLAIRDAYTNAFATYPVLQAK